MKVKASFPCCGQFVMVKDEPKQDRKCPKCQTWWRVDVRLLGQRRETGTGRPSTENLIRSLHEVTWTHVGLLDFAT